MVLDRGSAMAARASTSSATNALTSTRTHSAYGPPPPRGLHDVTRDGHVARVNDSLETQGRLTVENALPFGSAE
jgi:hypothetical protein